jgi:hypothetical protein
MTVVIADSSPLNYLTLIGAVEVLHRLYGRAIVPEQVIGELSDPTAPSAFRSSTHLEGTTRKRKGTKKMPSPPCLCVFRLRSPVQMNKLRRTSR